MHLLFFLAESLKNDCLEVLKEKKKMFLMVTLGSGEH